MDMVSGAASPPSPGRLLALLASAMYLTKLASEATRRRLSSSCSRRCCSNSRWAAALAVRPFLAARAPQSGALTVVVSADGQELDRLPLAQFGTHTYANNGYTLTVTAAGGAVSVTQSDCPGQDCVHSGAVSRAGQSIVCLPARIVVELVGAADGYDLVTG